jgi:hypothetical protein
MSRFITKLRLFAACLSRAIIRIRYKTPRRHWLRGVVCMDSPNGNLMQRLVNAESGPLPDQDPPA